MKRRKQKKPSTKMRPSRTKVWGRALARFRLSLEELAMAKAAEFTPTLMDEVARGRKIKRSVHDKLPLHATVSQAKRIKREIRARYDTLVGATAPPPAAGPSPARKAKEAKLAAQGKAKLCVTIPAVLRVHVAVECARAGLKLDEGVQAALEARFPRGTTSPPVPAPSRAA
jgi:hypothetical protein